MQQPHEDLEDKPYNMLEGLTACVQLLGAPANRKQTVERDRPG
jgi:hypothetical protein